MHGDVVGDAAFAGDTLFMPDGGSARAEPGGDAGERFHPAHSNIARGNAPFQMP